MAADGTSDERQRIESELLAALEAAKREWMSAKQAHAEVRQLSKDLPPGSADGHLAFQRATVAYCAALRDYSVALRDFTDFLMAGQRPRDKRREDAL